MAQGVPPYVGKPTYHKTKYKRDGRLAYFSRRTAKNGSISLWGIFAKQKDKTVFRMGAAGALLGGCVGPEIGVEADGGVFGARGTRSRGDMVIRIPLVKGSTEYPSLAFGRKCGKRNQCWTAIFAIFRRGWKKSGE